MNNEQLHISQISPLCHIIGPLTVPNPKLLTKENMVPNPKLLIHKNMVPSPIFIPEHVN